MSTNISINSNLNTYDEIPYESFPYSQAHPSHLRTIGILFGMNPPKLETANILELGCAAGGNLIPIALNYPKAQCVGVDLSKNQLDLANTYIKDLKLKNIKFHHMSITDIDESFGKFDYIICHGVISWVPEVVRDKIVEISKTLLSEKGIAYISYNTLPGWNMVRSIREMMLYHISTFTDIKEQINQARLLLNFLKDSTQNQDTPYAKFLQTEAEILANQPDHYLRHDHLSENNHQFYFSNFMAMANKNNLQYLGDASLPSMYIGNLPTSVAEKFAEIKDIIRTEQYMDYLNNRRFRSTLLCHQNVPLNRALTPEIIKKFYLSLRITPEVPLSEATNNENIKFYINNNKEHSISTTSLPLKALFYTMAENFGVSLMIDKWAQLAANKIPGVNSEQIVAEMLNNGMKLILGGYMQISSEADLFTNKEEEKLKVNSLVRYQSKNTNSLWVTNQKHERLGINILDKFALRYLDGNTSKADLIDHLTSHIIKGDLNLMKEEQKITDETTIRQELISVVDQLTTKIVQSALIAK